MSANNPLASKPNDAPPSQIRHLRPAEDQPTKGAKYAALDYNVGRVLGPQLGPRVIYGYLATSWYEFADPYRLAERNADRKKQIVPGSWVDATYRDFMKITGTRSKGTVVGWLRILRYEDHECPWGHCADEHPLIVGDRPGQNKPNRYRKWQCGADKNDVPPKRIRSEKLSQAAQRRVQSGQRLNGIVDPHFTAPPSVVEADNQLLLLDSASSSLEVLPQDFREQPSEVLPQDFQNPSAEVLPQDSRKSTQKTSPEVSPQDRRKSDHKTSLRGNSLNSSNQTAAEEEPNSAAAIEKVDEIDAVACEIVDAILELAARVEPDYPDERAWDVARRLAGNALGAVKGGPAFARSALIRAIGDRRLARARNPVGLLLRGVVGDENGHDRFLLTGAANGPTPHVDSAPAPETPTGLPPGLHEALLDRIRRDDLSPTWLRESEIPAAAVAIARSAVKAEVKSPTSSTPLVDKLATADPDGYVARLDAILANLELPVALRGDRGLDHPMILGMCRSRLEIELSTDDARRR